MARALALAVVTALLAAGPAGATFPARNGSLLVTYDDGNAKYFHQHFSLWRIGPQTGHTRHISICGSSIADVSLQCSQAGPPAASPDGRTVAVAALDRPEDRSDTERHWSIRLVSLETGGQTRIPLPQSDHRLVPGYHPIVRWQHGGDGFVLLRSLATEEVFGFQPARAMRVPLDGSSETELIAPVDDLDVAADGRLAFVRHRNVHIRDHDGTIRRLTSGWGFHPSWSPGGRFVAFSRYGRVFVIPSEGGEPRRVARGTDPVWSPDGTQIAFFREVEHADLGGVTYLYALSRRTGRVRRVSQPIAYEDSYGSGGEAGLDWAPRPEPQPAP
jgi:WD40-like Beta Propeller Repeat